MADLDIERGQCNEESMRGSADGPGPIIVPSALNGARQRGTRCRICTPPRAGDPVGPYLHPLADRRLERAG